ncbi:MAG: AI-2E family transporter [Gemmatimonadetes bacterium]|uniref:AI-2E family transporter n=1 Tax=Candidatus Kutchimonas denitrificans TaxID=3056748 RepID=A0AAE5CDR3_9BACT|nr:AI-2E family transporter [Gemmatimonadota bacterium]NIR76379.1 AI-2E family transporter [Candidatus Kutchimonas denitrificans]NIS03189.1 AI-2E family transporter [Gemmatimonadota bacterium]NIT66362.1 AI-2E family transporter [Gemmatimonadota bacterium]NIU54441.1 AI-2E family transporter [Gemmatimonadota bacterium]
MSKTGIDPERFRKGFLLLLVVAITLLFYYMIAAFVKALLLAAILAGLSNPLYQWFLKLFRGREAAASAVTIIIIVFVVLLPVSGFLGILVSQAIKISQQVVPWVQQQVQQPSQLDSWLQKVPILARLEPYQDQIISKIGQLASNLGRFLIDSLAATTRGTAVFFFHLFVMLYAMFFFLMDGPLLLRRVLYYMPLAPEDEERMVDRFVSVSRATIKGTLVIGILQGGLAGLAFWVVGIEGSVFWGTIMAVLSIIPGVGTALIWVPAVVYLLAVGRVGAGIGLFVWCAAVVGTVDNVIRPWLVGKDTKMPDLLILLGTLGGLIIFGAVGIIIGPIIAALFVTIWDIYGAAFKGVLPEAPTVVGQGENNADA